MTLSQRRHQTARRPGRRYWGKRCKDFHPQCLLCLAWRWFDQSGRFPLSDELKITTAGYLRTVKEEA